MGVPLLILSGSDKGEEYVGRTARRVLGPAATTPRRVVPVAQKRKASRLTVALSFLEIHEGGNGYLRFLMRQDRPTRWRALRTPKLELRIRDGSDRVLETQEDSSGSSMQSSYASLEANASVLVFGLPDSGDIEVEVLRVANLKMESPLLGIRMRLERLFRRRSSDGYLREEGSLSRLSRRLIGEEGPYWTGPWAFRFRICPVRGVLGRMYPPLESADR